MTSGSCVQGDRRPPRTRRCFSSSPATRTLETPRYLRLNFVPLPVTWTECGTKIPTITASICVNVYYFRFILIQHDMECTTPMVAQFTVVQHYFYNTTSAHIASLLLLQVIRWKSVAYIVYIVYSARKILLLASVCNFVLYTRDFARFIGYEPKKIEY